MVFNLTLAEMITVLQITVFSRAHIWAERQKVRKRVRKKTEKYNR